MRSFRLRPLLLAATVGATLLSAAPAEAAAPVSIAAVPSTEQPGELRVTVRASRRQDRVALYVDGRRRWVDRSNGRRFGRTSYVRAKSGRRRITVKARSRDGRVIRKTKLVRGMPDQRAPAPAATAPAAAAPAPKPAAIAPPAPSPSAPPATAPPLPAPPSLPQPGTGPFAPLLDAGFENGLADWNTAGVGDVVPSVVEDSARTGSRSAKVVLNGSQDRSELILGGSEWSDTVEFREGDERFYAFSVNVKSMMYGRPGAHNLLMQFKSDGTGSPKFGLMLWDYQGKRGLWSHGDSMGGDRYLAPIAHGDWQDVVIHFKASRDGRGFYRIYLNGALIDSRDGVSMIRDDRSYAYIKNGLYRNGSEIPGTSEIRLDAARLGTTLDQVLPG